MAKLYGLKDAVDFAAKNLINFTSIFARSAGQPLDKTSVWYPAYVDVNDNWKVVASDATGAVEKTGLERAQYYASTTAAYVGQELAVIDVTYAEDGVTVASSEVTFYGIQDSNGTLKELGSKPIGDNSSIEIAEDGTISVFGFDELTNEKVNYIPVTKAVTVDGETHLEIEWKPITDANTVTTVEASEACIDVVDNGTNGNHAYAIKVNVSKDEGNSLVCKDDGLYVNAPEPPHVPDYTIKKAATATSGSLATYELQKDGVSVAEKIEVVKDERLKNISGDLKTYIDEAIGKAEVAAMEFMGVITELPILTTAETGHFYKVGADIKTHTEVSEPNITKNFYADESDEPDVTTLYFGYGGQTVSPDNHKDWYNTGYSGESGRIIPTFVCGKKIKVECLTQYEDQSSGESSFGDIVTTQDYFEYSNGMDTTTWYCFKVTILESIDYDDSWSGSEACTLLSIVDAKAVPTDAETIKKGDSVVWNGYVWYVIPSGDDLDDTWRPVTIEDVALDQKTELKIAAGENVDITYDQRGKIFTISSTDTNTAHTHDVGQGLTVEGEGGTDGEVVYAHKDKPTADAENVSILESVTDENSDGATFVSKVLIDNMGHIAEVQTSTVLIPEISVEAATAKNPTPTENTHSVIASISADGHKITPTVIDVATAAGLANLNKVNRYTYTYDAAKTEWSAASTVESSIKEALVPASITKDGVTIIGGVAGLMTPEEKNKLAALVIGEGGGVEISGTITADNVKGLSAAIIDIVTGQEEGKLGIAQGAQVNIIEGIHLPDLELTPNTDKVIDLPYATAQLVEGVLVHSSGVVIGSSAMNQISYTNGIGEVNSLSTDKLVQGAKTLILNGGTATA